MNGRSTKWKFFGGACILAAGLALKAGAPLVPVVIGLALAGFVTWKGEGQTKRPAR